MKTISHAHILVTNRVDISNIVATMIVTAVYKDSVQAVDSGSRLWLL